MKLAEVLGLIIERLVMMIFVLTGVSGAFALNYVMWKSLVESDFANVKELRIQTEEQSRRLERLEQLERQNQP